MDIKEFIDQANKTPLLKKYREEHGNITKNTLREIGLVERGYTATDLMKLEKLLTGFRFPEATKKAQNAKAKDIHHGELIKRYHKQKLISDWRRKLGIPAGGLKTKSQFKKWIAGVVEDSQYVENGKIITTKFRHIRYSGNLKKMKNVMVLEKKLSRKEVLELALNEILEKWKLPERYRNAIQELLLFNRIILADSGTSWLDYETEWGAKKNKGIVFDADTTKEEIGELLKNSSVFNKMKKDLPGKTHRALRKPDQTQKIIDIYNERKKAGKTDKYIFSEIAMKFGLSKSAIKKRVKGR